MENLHVNLQAEHLPRSLSFANGESLEAEFLIIHYNKWRKSVKHTWY